MMCVTSPAQLSQAMPLEQVQLPIRELKKNKLRAPAKKQRASEQPGQQEPAREPPLSQQEVPRITPATVTLGRERRRWNASKRAFSPRALGTIEEGVEYAESVSPRVSFGHSATVCTSPDENVSAALAHQSELESRLAELERKLLELSAGQEQ